MAGDATLSRFGVAQQASPEVALTAEPILRRPRIFSAGGQSFQRLSGSVASGPDRRGLQVSNVPVASCRVTVTSSDLTQHPVQLVPSIVLISLEHSPDTVLQQLQVLRTFH